MGAGWRLLSIWELMSVYFPAKVGCERRFGGLCALGMQSPARWSCRHEFVGFCRLTGWGIAGWRRSRRRSGGWCIVLS